MHWHELCKFTTGKKGHQWRGRGQMGGLGGKSHTEWKGSQFFYLTVTNHCTRHTEPERDSPEALVVSDPKESTIPPVAGDGDSLEGGIQVRDAG